MALHKNFPKDKFAILEPEIRWFPADEALREQGYENCSRRLCRSLGSGLRSGGIRATRGRGAVSKALLTGGLKKNILALGQTAPRIHSAIILPSVRQLKLLSGYMMFPESETNMIFLPFDSLGRVSPNMFDEDWLRLVIKMATGSGKTKVMSLLLAWSYFHKLYEPESGLSAIF